MRIAWFSNAPWTEGGYGVQTKIVSKLLKNDGHDIAICANYGHAGPPRDADGITVMGHGFDAASQDISPLQAGWWLSRPPQKTGIAITLYDVWPLTDPAWRSLPVASWVPIDHKNVVHGVAEFISRESIGRWAIAMSKFGKEKLAEIGYPEDRLFYAPHSFVREEFRPVESEFRKSIDVPKDAHLTTIVANNKGKNPIRKSFPEMLLAWSKFAQSRKDAYLYLHTEIYGIAEGMNIVRYLQMINAPIEKIRHVDQFKYRQGIPSQAMAEIYSASDVLLFTSRGEGFGVPAIEAQACGAPIIVSDFTAQPELLGSGWKVGVTEDWDEYQAGWWGIPKVDEIVDALADSYSVKSNSKKSEKMRTQAFEFSKKYESKYVYEKYWKSIISDLEMQTKDINLGMNFND